ncbi:MAG: hypothetical protein Q9220_002902 [cf. Caloplaca sp. 1 TL-2023]
MSYSPRVERFRSEDLNDTAQLTSLWKFANGTFMDSVRKHPELGFSEGKRFEQPQDFIEEMGPNGVTFVQYSLDPMETEGGARMIATAGCKPWTNKYKFDERVSQMRREREVREKGMAEDQGPEAEESDTIQVDDGSLQQIDDEKQEPMVHDEGPDDVPRWEVMTVCVHPDWQKQGLADRLLQSVTEEVSSQVASGGGNHFKLVVRTLKEINEQYWRRKGFKTVAEKSFEPGLFGSTHGFHLLDMTRDHVVSQGY